MNLLAPSEKDCTNLTTELGTILYASPEQLGKFSDNNKLNNYNNIKYSQKVIYIIKDSFTYKIIITLW